MRDVGRMLILLGGVLLILGLIVTFAGPRGLGRLPGDIVIRRGNFTLYVPLMTSILLSIVLSVLVWLFRR